MSLSRGRPARERPCRQKPIHLIRRRAWQCRTSALLAYWSVAQYELDLLRTKLRDAIAARGNVVLLGGEPGIGKTRLAEEVAFEAAQHGMLVVWGRCWESDGAPPFWPWIELLRDVMRNCHQSALQHQLGNGASLIATLVPEIREQCPDLPAMPQLDPAEARFRLFDAVTGLFRNTCSNRPLLLLVEDLHWADKPSLLLLEFLVQRVAGVRLLVVGTYRDTDLVPDHPLTEMLGAAGREQAFDSISLHGLDSQAVGELVGSWVDDALPADATDLVHALWLATNGNPLFVREEVRSLVDDGRWPRDRAATAGFSVRSNSASARCHQASSGAAVECSSRCADNCFGHRSRVRGGDTGAGVWSRGDGTRRGA